ncbi:MAG: cytochrome C [Candidatus Rokuibacteriota bacterium]|nr:MAG: cytochrome C [Candidatus Rokubacteria bacterium]
MSTRDRATGRSAPIVALAVLLACVGCAGTKPVREGPNLGRAATPAEVAGWDISIAPDGTGLPPGSGTPSRGAAVYEQKCQSCHGAKGAGQPNDRLVGGQGTLASNTPVKTIGSFWPHATTVFDYVRRSMPYAEPQSLENDDVYAVTAYLLQLNGIIGENDVMDARTLPKVKMPNRDNFIVVYPTKR